MVFREMLKKIYGVALSKQMLSDGRSNTPVGSEHLLFHKDL